MRIGGAIEGIRLHPEHEAPGKRGRSHVHRKDGRDGIEADAEFRTGRPDAARRTRDVATEAPREPARVRDKTTGVAVRVAPPQSEVEIEKRGEGAHRALRKQLKGIVHAVRDELKQIVGRSVGDEDAAGKVDIDLHHALKKLNDEFRHAIKGAYRDAVANGTIDGEQLLTAVRSEFEVLLDRVAGALSPAAVDAEETPTIDDDALEIGDDVAGVPERLQELADRIEALLGELEQLLLGPVAEEVAAAPAPPGGSSGFGVTFELALSFYTESGLTSDARAPESDVDSVV